MWHHRSSKRIDDPWIIKLLRSFKPEELQSRSFGVNCCRVLENINFCEEADAFLKLITDGEYVIGALFTSDSLKDFYERRTESDPSRGESGELHWKKMILLLEEYRIVHRMTCGKYGELVLQVDKFSLIGNYPNILDISSNMILEHANRDSEVEKICQDIWERKLLIENPESLQLDTDMFSECNDEEFKTPLMNKTARISLENIMSAKGLLVISEKEQCILDSLPGWKLGTNVSYTKKKSVDNAKNSDKEMENHQDDSVYNTRRIETNKNNCLINNNSQNRNCIPATNSKEKDERRPDNLYCDETNSRTTKSNKPESDPLVQISSQSQDSSFNLNLEDSSDNSEIILDDCESAQNHNFAKQCTHQLVSEGKTKRKRSRSSDAHKSSPDSHISANFKRQCIHQLVSSDKTKEKRLHAVSCCKSPDSVDSPNRILRNSLVSVFEDNNGGDDGSDGIIDCNIEWTFPADHIQAMWEKFLEIYLDN